MRHKLAAGWMMVAMCLCALPAGASTGEGIVVPVNRSALVVSPTEMGEVLVANPEIADVHAHGVNNLSVIGKKIGRTTIRLFDRQNKVIRTIDVTVTYDLPAIRRALKNFLPNENIKVELVNTNVALTGRVSDATAAENAMRVAKEFIETGNSAPQAAASSGEAVQPTYNGILNLMQISSGQQVMLRVRVGEIQRDALKRLGVSLSARPRFAKGLIDGGTGDGVAGLFPDAEATFVVPSDRDFGLLAGVLSTGGDQFGVGLHALERDGLFKLLAEPNLVAMSGEEAEFLAGGELPIPVAQAGSGGDTPTITIQYKPFGVGVKFTPYVLSENRIRMAVQPEVSEVSNVNQVQISGFTVPSITTRRTKTTVELAPGESFMLAGLIKDTARSNIDQLPGAKDLPVLGALFRSTDFQRNETELVIAVTPYLVDPAKSSDVKLPTDNFAPASQMEMFFYGALSSMAGGAEATSQRPNLEGPIGFIVD